MTQTQATDRQAEAAIAAYLRKVAAHPYTGHEVRLIVGQLAQDIETGRYKREGCTNE